MEYLINYLSGAIMFIFGKEYHDKIVAWVKNAEQMTLFFLALAALFLIIFMPRLVCLILVFGLMAFYGARKFKELLK